MDKKLKIQWVINVLLLLFTLLMLIMSVFAWFSSRSDAEIEQLHTRVMRRDLKLLEVPTTIEFPFSFRTAEADADDFASGGAVEKTYIIEGEGKLAVSVDCMNNGILAYVCDSTETTDYFSEIDRYITALEESTGTSRADWSYSDFVYYLDIINSRSTHGDSIADQSGNLNTHIKIVYWAEYDHLKENLVSDTYWSPQDLEVIISFVAQS